MGAKNKREDMYIRNIALLSVVLTGFAGCRTTYTPPADDVQTAKLLFDMSYDNGFALGTSRTQEYLFVKDNKLCETPALMAGSLKKSKNGALIEAGKKLTISSQALAFTGTGTGLNQGSCVNLSSFTPQSGKTYEISQNTLEGLGCVVDVKDKSTGETPSDFYNYSQVEMEQITEDCANKKSD